METAPAVLSDTSSVPGRDAGLAALGQGGRLRQGPCRHCETILVLAPRAPWWIGRCCRRTCRRRRRSPPRDRTVGRCHQRVHRGPRAPSPLRARDRSAAGLTRAARDAPFAAPAAASACRHPREARAASARPLQQEDAGRGHRHRRRHHLADRRSSSSTRRAARRRSSAGSSRSTRSTIRSSCARWARCSARRSSDGNRVDDLENGDEIFPAMLAAIRGARETITFETYIYWSGADRQASSPTRSPSARAPASRCTCCSTGSAAQKMDEALLDEMKSAGVEVQQYHPLHWYTPRAHEQSHAPQAARRRRPGRLHRRRRHRRRVGRRRAGPRPLARLALPLEGPGRRADAGRVHGQLDQDHGQGAARRATTSRRCQPRATRSAQVFTQLAERRQREHAADVPAVDHAAEQDDRPVEPRTSCPTTSRVHALRRGAEARRDACGSSCPASTSTPRSCARRRARAGASCSRPASQIYEYQPTMFHCKMHDRRRAWSRSARPTSTTARSA